MADFYIDEDTLNLVFLLPMRGHQAVAAHQLGIMRTRDEEQLLAATERGAILITHNGKDFRMLHRAWLLWSVRWNVRQEHGGILVIPQRVDADQITSEIVNLVSLTDTLRNRLYLWTATRGWDQYGAQ